MPKVRFLQGRTVQDGSGTTFEAGKVYDLPQASCDHWTRRGIAEMVTDETPQKDLLSGASGSGEDSGEKKRPRAKADVLAAILAAAEGLNPEDASNFTADGRPQVKAIEAALGYDISADERDEAWAGRQPQA